MLNIVISQSHELTNTQFRIMGLSGLSKQFFTDISTDQVEKLSSLAFVAAQKVQNELWFLVAGNMLAGGVSDSDD